MFALKILLKNKDARLIIFDGEDHIAFITDKVNAIEHAHYYIQITIGLNDDFQVRVEGIETIVRGIIVDSNISHSLDGNDSWQYYMLINPESNLGLEIKRVFLKDNKTYKLDSDLIKKIGPLLNEIECAKTYQTFLSQTRDILNINYKDHNILDKRCEEIINYIEQNSLDQLTIRTLAKLVFLSESRLSHLFKKEIGISISSYLLHMKMRKAFYLIFQGYKLTDAAIQSGFSSSSHFSRSVLEKLGMSPSMISKDSRYMQV